MKTENKILVGGLTLAAVVCAAGFWNEHRLEKKLAVVVAECEAENATNRKTATPPLPPGYTLDTPDVAATSGPITAEDILGPPPQGVSHGPRDEYKADALVCEPFPLSKLSDAVGIQKEIADAYSDASHGTSMTTPVAAAIGVLAVIPWLWYFFLHRIVELRNAIGGKAP